MIKKSALQKVIMVAVLIIIITVSGCNEKDQGTLVQPMGREMAHSPVSITTTENSSLVYGGQLHLPTNDRGDYIKVIRMYDTAENKVCYVTYNGISCDSREAK